MLPTEDAKLKALFDVKYKVSTVGVEHAPVLPRWLADSDTRCVADLL